MMKQSKSHCLGDGHKSLHRRVTLACDTGSTIFVNSSATRESLQSPQLRMTCTFMLRTARLGSLALGLGIWKSPMHSKFRPQTDALKDCCCKPKKPNYTEV
mmetsp:Transcript_5716/g.21629  ORF Transcript_5716/g.21629 Transcript_5716/m.21629 type:complete len:101 (+) Transcript_5716:561-863(+)